MTLVVIAAVACALAAIPAALCLVNLPRFRPPPHRADGDGKPASISVLIPARNEAGRIGETLDALRASRDVDLEIVVMDDASQDATVERVRERAAVDDRIRLEKAPPLPEGWNGKQHACHALADTAERDALLFLDADVHVAPDAVGRIAEFLHQSGAALASGIPRQMTVTFFERLLIPLIHFVLLGFLPLGGMRRSLKPAFGAGCGQIMATRRAAYRTAGGHEAIRTSRHDGVMLPRAFRRRGLRTDLFDATDMASCRMYENGREVLSGLAKNATEGMAAPVAIVPWTLLLLGGQVLPLALLAVASGQGGWALATILAGVGVVLGLATRAVLALRFRQPLDSVLLHPLGVTVLVSIQWVALLRRILGRSPVAWKGR